MTTSIPGTPDPSKLSLLTVLVELSERETDRYWTRYSIMLYANTGLVAVATVVVTLKSAIAFLLPALLGALLSVAWLRVNRSSIFFHRRWHADFDALVDSDDYLRNWIRGRVNPRVQRPIKTVTSTYDTVPIAFLVVWFTTLTISAIISIKGS